MPRQFERISLSLEVMLEFSSGRREARISDLSMGGCFVDTILNATEGEPVNFELRLSNVTSLALSGEVTYFMPRIGFGLRFTNLTDEKKSLLAQLITSYGGNPYAAPE